MLMGQSSAYLILHICLFAPSFPHMNPVNPLWTDTIPLFKIVAIHKALHNYVSVILRKIMYLKRDHDV